MESNPSIHAAAKSGDAAAVRRLLAADRRLVTARDQFTGDTPLHWAAQEGHAEAAKVLLENGADVNAANVDGRTPLHKAAFRGQHAVIELLVEAGANLHVRDMAGQMPEHAAQRPDTRELLRRLRGPEQRGDVPLAQTPAELGLSVNRICLHPKCREAVTVSHNAVLTRWALEQPPRMLAGLQTGHPWIGGVATLPGEEEFLAATPSGVEVRRWDDLCGNRSFDPQGITWDHPSAVAASADGRWVAVRDRPEQLSLVERASGRVTDGVEAGERTMSVTFSADSRLLATACSFQGGGRVRVDDVETDGRLTRRRELHRSDYKTRAAQFVDTLACVAFDSSGRYLALFQTSAICHDSRRPGWRGDVVLYDLTSGLELWSASVDAGVTGDPRPLEEAGHPMGYVTDVVFARADAFVACGATRGAVLFYAVADGSLMRGLILHDSAGVTALAYDPYTGLVWAGLENGELKSVD